MVKWHVAPLRFAPAFRALGVCEHIWLQYKNFDPSCFDPIQRFGMSTWGLTLIFDPVPSTYFRPHSSFQFLLPKFQLNNFSDLGSKWESRENARNLRIRFYMLAGRVRTLRVPTRRLGALTRGISCDEKKSPLETISTRQLHSGWFE